MNIYSRILLFRQTKTIVIKLNASAPAGISFRTGNNNSLLSCATSLNYLHPFLWILTKHVLNKVSFNKSVSNPIFYVTARESKAKYPKWLKDNGVAQRKCHIIFHLSLFDYYSIVYTHKINKIWSMFSIPFL